ncbi:transcriptional corepressor of histone-like protein genes [Periconia macrospinosa]|uniref:Histone transcription regulator 3 homolog n=1 Tax=Periconia macrospinosa TaxID=97972 RepID=A0A2V1ECJ0_9PLEO|nr:transcriptional corepressor of histone-like protein genes [Periconia macrospinosa]
MSTWNALNVESDHEEEDDVDDTKEIQIEEALKLYQTALKYHSEGPPSFEKAAQAYKELFNSEIFKYAESLSEYKRHELYADSLVFDTILQDDDDPDPVQSTGGNESAPNTLPQILHLSYKNHGQFLLEMMQHWIREHGPITQQQVASQISGALTYFAEALDKEDTDLDLWLRTASVAAMLGSQRITRFCLEAVLDGNDELYDNLLAMPGLEEGFAGQQLRQLVAKLEDNLSLMQAPLSGMKQKKLSKAMKDRLNPYPFAPLPADIAATSSLLASARPPEHVVLNCATWDWASVGEAILRHYMAEQTGLADGIPPGSCLKFDVPPDAHFEESNGTNAAPAVEEMAVEDSGDTPKLAAEDSPARPNDTELVNKEGNRIALDDQETVTQMPADENSLVTTTETSVPLSRKRSTDSAGLPETADGGRLRSKRLRARETTETASGTDVVSQDITKQQEDHTWARSHADECLFEVLNDMCMRLGIAPLKAPKELRAVVTESSSDTPISCGIDRAVCDLYTALRNPGSSTAQLLLSTEPVDLGGASREAGLNAFLGHSKSTNSQASIKPTLHNESLATFIHKVNDSWLSTKEVAFSWLEMLLSPGRLSTSNSPIHDGESSYMQYRWTDDLKRHLVQIIVNLDDYIYEVMCDRIDRLNSRILNSCEKSRIYRFTDFDNAQVEIVETLFELHLDVYSLIKHPNSGVDDGRKTLENDSLERWSALSREALQLRSDCEPAIRLDKLGLRHVWASVFQMNVSDDILPEHILYAMQELKSTFEVLDGQAIPVQNNAVMPELSVAAVDRELVRISMKDFFLKVFDTDEKDPVAVIESLEPILEPTPPLTPSMEPEPTSTDENRSDSGSTPTVGPTDPAQDVTLYQSSPSHEMRKFLDSASVNLRLSLWQRLREAYEGIEYPPKVLSCYLRSIETLVGEFKTASYKECALLDRITKLISRLRIIDEIVVKILQVIKNEEQSFACLTYEHMQSSMSAIFHLLRIMSGVNFVQDSIRAGQLNPPRIEGLPSSTFTNMINRLNDTQVRLWMLQYHLLKEGMSQNRDGFPAPSDEAFEFLRHVHHATGVRGFCHSAGRLFLRLAKDEILRLENVAEPANRDLELCQILHDLYGLKTFSDPLECQDYGSVVEVLDKKTATALLPFIMSQADKISIKDLPKHDLKVTIDKIHGALGRQKSYEEISTNRKVLTTYFRSPINPVALFNCLKGVGSLVMKDISRSIALPASYGWYFLMGNIALNKFSSQKRQGQGPTEDLNFAQVFFIQDLEFSTERWETWYRLALTNDYQLEEAVSWTADKMNNNSVELLNYQRTAIHCYAMAVACAVRDAEPSPQTRAKVARMYTDFGNRIYASSRAPFGMNAYAIKDTEHKFYSGAVTQKVYQDVPFKPLSTYTAWKFASVLFKRAIKGDPDKWWNHYMLAKCLWKMYCANADAPDPPSVSGPSWQSVIQAIVNAIETLPEKKERGREPILEPHYKLVSITHKLFQRKVIDHTEGTEILQQTTFAHNLSSDGADDWERYVLSVLKALRTTDKSSWHHRIIARAAHVIYEESNEMVVIHGAKHELTQMFTKTMAPQVWKPENERPGRHFVYTSRYTKFLIHLLDKTGDKTNLELLAKRVRRKQTDFFEHSKLWQELCLCYIGLLRRIGKVPENHEDTVLRTLDMDEFTPTAARLEAWCHLPTTQNEILDVLRDVNELKRLNNGLMKAALIDDLQGDTYALLYNTIGPTLQPSASELEEKKSEEHASSTVSLHVDGNNENLNDMYQVNQGQGPNQAQPPQTDTVVKSRVKTVGRREIQRRAEACVQKAATSMTIPIRSPPTTHAMLSTHESQQRLDKPLNESSANTSANEQGPGATSGTATAAASVRMNSTPSSIDEDADDESELSELGEDEVQELANIAGTPPVIARPTLFPNLMAHKKDQSTKTEEADDASNAAAEDKADGGDGSGDEMDTT